MPRGGYTARDGFLIHRSPGAGEPSLRTSAERGYIAIGQMGNGHFAGLFPQDWQKIRYLASTPPSRAFPLWT